ncbi:MAG: four helix bundle protein [Fibrobacter sp.]|mgnify:CR=1 FL=1|nr:four helix bundle protein [Fibrobacter sp.]
MRDHTKLRAFNLAGELVIVIYQITRLFPKEEMYGLVSQMRRAAVSVASNIVEGCARSSDAEFVRFLDIAFGSLRELLYQYSLAIRLGYVSAKDMEDIECSSKFVETEKVLAALIRSMRRKAV